MNNKINKIYIYPSYSMRDYERLVYLLDSDAEFNQAIIEAEFLKSYCNEVILILPKKKQRDLNEDLLPKGIKTIEKEYQVNVGSERFFDDTIFFTKLNLGEDDILYSCFLHKYKLFEKSGIKQEQILYTFWHYYPEFNIDFYRSESLKRCLGIIFRSEKQRKIFIKGYPEYPKEKCLVMRSHPGKTMRKKPYMNKLTIKSKRTLMIPTRFDHEDFNHTWEALMVALSLKKEVNFNLILCNPNNSGDLSNLIDIAYEIGPIPKTRFNEILNKDIGVIYIKKETDYGGTKGAPEYLSSNLIFISNDYEINPWDVKNNSNSQAYSWIKKFLTCDIEEYLDAKYEQLNICEKFHGDKEVTRVFNKIFNIDELEEEIEMKKDMINHFL